MYINQEPVLAALTRGGNLPYRRLCVDFGARVTFSEMAYAKELIRGAPREKAMMKRHPSETFFGVQFAAKTPEEAAEAAKIVEQSGASFVDLNCGCPIHEAVKRGMGARLLRQPRELGAMVAAMAGAVKIPISVKLRIGYEENKINILETSQACEDAGATAVTIHGRTREQRYTRAADWDQIRQVVEARKLEVAGNGDVLTYFEADQRRETGVAALSVARGALIKPWIFQEINEKRELLLDAEQRCEVYWRLTQYMKEHFGDDERGVKKANNFLPWHFGLFHRYRHLPADQWEEASRNHPLLQTRFDDRPLSQEPVDLLLRSENETIHSRLCEIFWAADDAKVGFAAVQEYAEECVKNPPPNNGRGTRLEASG